MAHGGASTAASCVTVMLLSLVLWLQVWTCAGDDVPATKEDCTPQQTHIAYGDTIQEMIIVWSTRDQCSTDIQYGDGPFQLTKTVPGESRKLDGASNLEGLHFIHRVKLRDLTPGSTYFYKPVSNKASIGPYIFQVPPQKATELKLIIVSDVNISSPIAPRLTEEKDSGKYAAILHTGNIAMNLNSDNGTKGDRYLRWLDSIITSLPYLTSPGPAEVDVENSFSNYLHRFSMPQTNWPMSLDKMWYSLDLGPVHLISYSTEVFFTADGMYSNFQHDWLIKDLKLANENRESVPWVVAFGHQPMYCSYEDPDLLCHQKMSKIKSELEDIMYHFGVDIIIQSYGKAYERSFPMYKGVSVSDNYTNPLGPVHIINGGAVPWDENFNFTFPEPTWLAYRFTNNSILTYGRLNILNNISASYELVNAESGAIIDSFTITQEKHGQFNTSKLPQDISAEIDKEIVDAGGKPGVLNIEEVGADDARSSISTLLDKDNRTRLIIGVSCAIFVVIALIIVFVAKNMRRRKRVTRRWEQMDINYGKKFYSKAPDKDEDNDFEIDMSDGTEPTRKLLNADD